MNNTIEIEVTLLDMVKAYNVEPVAVTGIENKSHALMALRQAFIMSGKPLAQDSLLARHPAPAGTKQAEWLKTLEGTCLGSAISRSPGQPWILVA